MIELDKIIPPQKDTADQIHEYLNEIAKMATGGFFNPLVNYILPSFHQKKFEIWCNEVYKAIKELEEEKASVNNLIENDEFISLLKECILIASRNHQEEKLNSLKRILINSIESNISFDIKIIFTKFIDTLTASHILILKQIKKHINEINHLTDFQEIIDTLNLNQYGIEFDNTLIRLLISDLEKLGIVILSNKINDKVFVRNSLKMLLVQEDKTLPYIVVTDLGISFIQFIEKP